MSFIRPEIAKTLHRWREALIGVAVLGAGLWGALSTFGITRWLGVVAILAGAALIWEGIRRARFPADTGGLGVVRVTERQITYLSPVGGGMISVDELFKVEITTNDLGPFAPDLFWVFKDTSGNRLSIPGNAEGSELLFDVLTTLSGVDYEAITNANLRTEVSETVVWQKPGTGSGNIEILPPRS